MRGHVDYLLDPEWSLGIGDVTRPEWAARFEPVTGHAPDFGYTKSMIWLRLAVRNESTEIREWRLLFRENFLQRFDVYQSRGAGGFVTLVSQNERSPFTSRPLGYPELVAPFVLPPGEQSVIFIRYWSGGSSELSFSIETAQSFDAITVARTATNFIYYGMMLLLVIIALMAFAVVRLPVFLAYAGYSGSALLFIMHADGNAFKFLWPHAPLFNGFASIAIGSGIILFGSIYSMLFLRTRRQHPVLDKLLGATVLLTLAMLASAVVVDHQVLKKVLVLVAFAAILLFVVAGLVAARRRFKQVRFYVLAWSGAVISSAIMTGRHWLGIDISQEVQFNSMRIVMVSDAALMGLAIWDYFSQLRQARQRALQDSLRHAQQNLQLSRRLELLEQQYALAKRLSERQERRIADTIHDLNQPLHALRLNVGNLGTDGADAAGRQRIEETFAYLEKLVAGHLDRSAASADIGDSTETAADGADTLGVGAILRGVFEMFEPDARAKGLRFRHVETSAEAVCEPLALMRIVTNLVANAIKYTDRGGVLLGCRRVGGVLRVEVHDSGPGLTPDEFEHARQRATRLDRDARRADGKGLGLSIAQELAQSRGYALTLDPRRRSGTGLRLDLPRVRERRSPPVPACGERVGARG